MTMRPYGPATKQKRVARTSRVSQQTESPQPSLLTESAPRARYGSSWKSRKPRKHWVSRAVTVARGLGWRWHWNLTTVIHEQSKEGRCSIYYHQTFCSRAAPVRCYWLDSSLKTEYSSETSQVRSRKTINPIFTKCTEPLGNLVPPPSPPPPGRPRPIPLLPPPNSSRAVHECAIAHLEPGSTKR